MFSHNESYKCDSLSTARFDVFDELVNYESIFTKIENKNLVGHNFYIYIVPFTEIEENRKEILGEVLN